MNPGVLQQLLNGITLGLLYANVALGLTLTYGVLKVLHIAHAEIYALGAYLGLLAFRATDSVVASIVAGAGGSALAGWAVQRWLYRPLLGRPRIVPLIASIGVVILMEDLYRLLAGPHVLTYPPTLNLPLYLPGPVVVSGAQLLLIGIGLALVLLLWVALNRTRVGLAWKAVAQDRQVAAAMGINVKWAIGLNFAVGSAMAGIAGVLVGMYYNSVSPTMGYMPGYKALAIIVLGGMGSVQGALAASLLLGLVEEFSVVSLGRILPRDSLAFIALILVLLARPEGIFAWRERGALRT